MAGRGISRDDAIRQFRQGNYSSEGDAREAARKLLEAMAEGNKDPLNRMGKLIGDGFEERAGSLITAASVAARTFQALGPSGGSQASAVVGGAAAGAQVGMAAGPWGALAGAAVGAGLGMLQYEKSEREGGRAAFFSSPIFAGQQTLDRRYEQGKELQRLQSTTLDSNRDIGKERSLERVMAIEGALENEPLARVMRQATDYEMAGRHVRDDELRSWYRWEQQRSARAIDVQMRGGAIASQETERMIGALQRRQTNLSALQSAYDGRR
jgi:hypothetical protein